MIDRHWDGIAAYCRPENKVSLGFVEGAEQQDPRDPASRLWLARRGLSTAQNTDLHAARLVAGLSFLQPQLRLSYLLLTCAQDIVGSA
jgi:hypothetical protein